MRVDHTSIAHSRFCHRRCAELCIHGDSNLPGSQSNNHSKHDLHQQLPSLYLGWGYSGYAYMYDYRRVFTDFLDSSNSNSHAAAASASA